MFENVTVTEEEELEALKIEEDIAQEKELQKQHLLDRKKRELDSPGQMSTACTQDSTPAQRKEEEKIKESREGWNDFFGKRKRRGANDEDSDNDSDDEDTERKLKDYYLPARHHLIAELKKVNFNLARFTNADKTTAANQDSLALIMQRENVGSTKFFCTPGEDKIMDKELKNIQRLVDIIVKDPKFKQYFDSPSPISPKKSSKSPKKDSSQKKTRSPSRK
mmetsp:Transcript_53583/g.86731  ORF Transcript_53583/g.86731 Transcript_53583/m.86731 type:complete len:221 (-) Transcript_53583:60-722(-)